MKSEITKHQDLIKSNISSQFRVTQIDEEIEKGKSLPVGTIREHGGVKKQKQPSGEWKVVGETKRGTKGESDEKPKMMRASSILAKEATRLRDPHLQSVAGSVLAIEAEKRSGHDTFEPDTFDSVAEFLKRQMKSKYYNESQKEIMAEAIKNTQYSTK